MNTHSLKSLLLLQSDSRDSRAGFTLVEILLVVAILGILAGVAVVSMSGKVERANIAAARTSIGAIRTAIDLYEVDNGGFPAGLQNLIVRGSENNWNGPYLRDARMAKDPWGNDFQYAAKEGSVEIRSGGPDNQMGTADDITN
jgi:general secretion pathway protein G